MLPTALAIGAPNVVLRTMPTTTMPSPLAVMCTHVKAVVDRK